MKKPEPKSIISIDIGKKRIGLAGCDPLGLTVTRLQPILRKSFSKDIEILKALCQKRTVEGLVIGLPLDLKGNRTPQSDQCEKYGNKIVKVLKLPVAWVNEQCSTWTAGEEFNLHSDRTGQLDSAAAALLLEQWLLEGPELQPIKLASYPERHMNCDAGS